MLNQAPIAPLGTIMALVAALPGLVTEAADPAPGGANWHTEPGFRWRALAPQGGDAPGFTPLDPRSTGIVVTNTVSEGAVASNRTLPNGSGVALGDVDDDGRPDVALASLEGPVRLFRNAGGMQFEEMTAKAGLPLATLEARGVVLEDVDGDGRRDLLVSTVRSGVRAFLQASAWRFREATRELGLESSSSGTTLALADVEGNGTLDLYVANYRADDIRDRGQATFPSVNGRPAIPPSERDRFVFREGRLDEYGQADQFYLNDGRGRFERQSWTEGRFVDENGAVLASPPFDWGLSASFRDINGDLAPDLYVCNDYWTPDRFWINDGRGHFRAIGARAQRKMSSSSMGVDFADLDRDGHVDFLVVDMLSRDPALRKRQSFAERPAAPVIGGLASVPQVMRNTLFRNRGDGTFAEIAEAAGLAASDWSWCPVFLDVDLDGFEDVIISAGHFRDVQDRDAAVMIRSRQHSWAGIRDPKVRQAAFTRELLEHYRLYPRLDLPLVTFRNRGDWTFEERTVQWGTAVPGVHHGLATADLDGDGDLDLVVNDLNGPARLFRNESGAPRIAVRLRGRPQNVSGIGATVLLHGGSVPRQSFEMVAGGRYLSGSEPIAVFAAGSGSKDMSMEVRWRDGTRTMILGVQANRLYEIDQEKAVTAARMASPKAQEPFFRDVSGILGHRHLEAGFTDFDRQPLLPFKVSQGGPGVAWFDLEGDGFDDLLIAPAAGDVGAVFRSDGRGGFIRGVLPMASGSSGGMGPLLGWVAPTRRTTVLGGLTGADIPSAAALLAWEWKGSRASPVPGPVPNQSGVSALALGNLGSTSGWALFAGGGAFPGRYPMALPSRLYRWGEGGWTLDASATASLSQVGIVSAAVWTDLDADGTSELVLACEWGPIRVFRIEGGRLVEVTGRWGLADATGLWKGVAPIDVNGDGRIDLVAANWGRNSPYRASASQPLTVFHGDFAKSGGMDLVETEHTDRGALVPRASWDRLASALPWMQGRFESVRRYSESSVEEFFGDAGAGARRVTAKTLDSSVLVNRGDRFEIQPLARVAQEAPSFGVAVADVDGDGHDDVFLSQGFFATGPELTRLDAGVGLLLRGDGSGNLIPVPPVESGVFIHGEQRGAAFGDFDGDGRPDLAVAQNGEATRLFRNVGGRPGLRVRWRRRDESSWVGATLRLTWGERRGSVREFHAGEGYQSQQGGVAIVTGPVEWGPPKGVVVRWPGGRSEEVPIPSGAVEVEIP